MTTHSIFEVFSEENATGVAYKNKSLKRGIINHLDESGNSTITEMAQALNISVPKTTSLVNELIQDGLIRDHGKIDSTGGRRASMYGLVAESCYFIGVDVKHDYINIGLLDFKKNLVSSKMRVPYKLENTPASLQQLIQAIRSFIADQTIDTRNILAVCFNLSGRINTKSGYSYSYFHFNEEPLSAIMEKELGIRTFLENDSRAMAYGEFHDGIVHQERNVLFVNLDYGIGLGILIDGKVYYGKSGFGGEFGHIPVFSNEIICHCGKKGCLETEASGQALLRVFRESIGNGSTSSVMKNGKKVNDVRLADIMEAIRQEDVLSIELIAGIGEKIGRGLAVLINIFNPELVILGGTMAETGDYIRLPIRSALNKYSLSLVNNDTQVKLSKLGEKAGLIGGCLIARNNLLTAMNNQQD
ncbi:ROK family transcriptional regulator [Pseudobacter ginsenosidimutans]|jgi:predicted NBD/HSP70 family sugar kinase|uniref:Putative NBD/HSP70 family sugar kinase n=1 Tax=Pseudobacter ginsenosidimutans TaxID=661488 RepID=A0A4Q7N4B1_9BACT|nr:ROK family transcriptional regulator [Pseudobacter ginsenosidimutans]QEC44378.1 ROK family transcriptional regulator [Pseudobacter ginsenosidimutans]RZS75843.1 putative NBD/HSP70 family sugar kinase [Pseudobacter ginsenosidimutans]